MRPFLFLVAGLELSGNVRHALSAGNVGNKLRPIPRQHRNIICCDVNESEPLQNCLVSNSNRNVLLDVDAVRGSPYCPMYSMTSLCSSRNPQRADIVSLLP